MFWPPSGRANNKVTISDTKFTAVTEDAPRHDSYVMDACFLAPWLSWDDDEGPWEASDPLCRVLLLGESGIRLRSLNTDTHGDIIMLTSGPAGLQQWEVVSFFDWYVEGSTDKSMAMCWCRLWVPAEDDDDDDDDDEGFAGFIQDNIYDGDIQEPSDTWSVAIDGFDGDGHVVFCIRMPGSSVSVTSVTINGDSLSFIHDANDMMGGRMEMWSGDVDVPSGDIDITFSGSIAEFNIHLVHLTGITGVSPAEFGSNLGGGSNPSISTGTSVFTEGIAVGFFGSNSAGGSMGAPGLTFNSPFDANMGVYMIGTTCSRAAFRTFTSSVSNAIIDVSHTPSDWGAILCVFH